jgi:hypothetical protein
VGFKSVRSPKNTPCFLSPVVLPLDQEVHVYVQVKNSAQVKSQMGLEKLYQFFFLNFQKNASVKQYFEATDF